MVPYKIFERLRGSHFLLKGENIMAVMPKQHYLTTLDLPALRRHAVGFDRFFDEIARSVEMGGNSNYPPYNIIRDSEQSYRVEIAVAGFSEAEISVVVRENILVITGTPEAAVEEEVLHRGIAHRAFERVFTLADNVEVTGGTVHRGILTLTLEQRVPEEKKPKKIALTFRD